MRVILRIIPALILVQTLYFKFSGAPESVYIFETLGLEPWQNRKWYRRANSCYPASHTKICLGWRWTISWNNKRCDHSSP